MAEALPWLIAAIALFSAARLRAQVERLLNQKRVYIIEVEEDSQLAESISTKDLGEMGINAIVAICKKGDIMGIRTLEGRKQ